VDREIAPVVSENLLARGLITDSFGVKATARTSRCSIGDYLALLAGTDSLSEDSSRYSPADIEPATHTHRLEVRLMDDSTLRIDGVAGKTVAEHFREEIPALLRTASESPRRPGGGLRPS
jgi:hypothetical protein